MIAKKMTGWRYGALVGGLVGAIALAMYPIAIAPYIDPKPWRKLTNLQLHIKFYKYFD